MSKPRIIVFASGAPDGGGTGFQNLVEAVRNGGLNADIVAVASNHERGGVREKADKYGIPFVYFSPSSDYRNVVKKTGAKWVALSGWLKKAEGLDPRRTFNIHPALLSQIGGRFGGHGMYGKKVHEAVKAALDAGEITDSGFSMHFVTDELDRGPVFFEYRVPLEKGVSAAGIEKAVRQAEHEWQPKITNMVVHREISWDGKDPASLNIPPSYQHLPRPKMWC